MFGFLSIPTIERDKILMLLTGVGLVFADEPDRVWTGIELSDMFQEVTNECATIWGMDDD